MSLNKAFASVLKAMRATRMLSQINLAEVSSRTYISKLERGQCSPTLEMITSLSAPLRVSPLTLIALTIGAESGQSIKSLVDRLESELTELDNGGVLDNLHIPLATSPTQKPNASSPKTRYSASSFQQAELCFAD